MSVDLTEFEALSGPRKRTVCRVGQAMAGMDADARAQLVAACATPNAQIGSGAISKWLERRDFMVSVNQVTSHRRNQCSCAHD